MPAQIALAYVGSLRCTASSLSTGRSVQTDAATAIGGLGEDFTPTELVAVALGTCILTTIAMVAERHKIDLTGLSATMEKEMQTAPGRRIASIGMSIGIPSGVNLQPSERERLENAAQRCPVKQSLHPDIEIRVKFIYPEQ